mmetsp:Transcript_48944/g.98059  ORF Transcript_48944/g.98059 Transcript_48944/m.98059 type:complete len:230 (+) Transcript_48944:131-820(+)
MGAGKSLVWVPDNEKLLEKLDEAQSWSKAEDLTGWLALNDGKLLGKAIREAEGTGRLSLAFNGLGDGEAKEIAKGMKANRTIKKLSLANNHIHAEGMKHIADGLMPPEDGKLISVLEDLDLRNNSAGPAGATALGKVLAANRTLTKLNLHWNNIGNEGLYEICMGLTARHRECSIDLSYGGYDVTAKCTPDGDEDDWNDMIEYLNKTGIPINDEDGKGVIGIPEEVTGD